MKYKLMIILALAALILLSGCPEPETLGSIPAEWKACEIDSDCAETQADCCSCGSGGTQTGINKTSLSQWEEKIERTCKDIGCIALFSCNPGYPACVNNVCEYIPSSQ